MKLATGHYIQVRQVGTRYGHKHAPTTATTLHLIDFYESEEAFKAGKRALTRQDVVVDWNGPHPNPGARLKRLLEWYCRAADQHQWRDKTDPKVFWCATPDRHGILAHETMQPFKAVRA